MPSSPSHPPSPPPPPPAGKRRGVWAILIFQIPFLYGLAVTYTVTGGQNMGSFIALAQVPAAWGGGGRRWMV